MDIPIKLIVTNITEEEREGEKSNRKCDRSCLYAHGVARGSSINDRAHCRSMCLPNEGRSRRNTHCLSVCRCIVDVVFYVLNENVSTRND